MIQCQKSCPTANETMKHPAKGKFWFYIGTALMVLSLLLFLRGILYANSVNLSEYYFWCLAAFLASGIFRVYAITPLMCPTLASIVIAILIGASQLSGMLFSLGHPLPGFVIGNFTEIYTFSWVYSRSKAMYDANPL